MATVRNTLRLTEPKAAPKPAAEQQVDARYLGGGWYELPDGRRVHGKEAVREATQ